MVSWGRCLPHPRPPQRPPWTDSPGGPRLFLMSLEIQASSDQRVGFIGQTRMGKTFLAEHLLHQQPRVIVVDPKGRVNWPGYHLTDNPVAALLEDKVIYRPPTGAPPADWWMEAVHTLHEHGGGVIYVDEMSYITTANSIPKGLADAFRLGGEIGVAIWFAAQESTTVHNTTLRQSEMLCLFYNQGASDRDKLDKVTGDMAHITRELPAWHFVVFVRGETYDHDAIPIYRVAA